jgi:hypothetical protein
VDAEQLAKEMLEAMVKILHPLPMVQEEAAVLVVLDPMLLILVELVVLEVQVPILVQLSQELQILECMLAAVVVKDSVPLMVQAALAVVELVE